MQAIAKCGGAERPADDYLEQYRRENSVWIRLCKPVPGLPGRKVGSLVPVHEGRAGWVYHLWKTVVLIPEDAFDEVIYGHPDEHDKRSR